MLEEPRVLTHQQLGCFKSESHLFLCVSSAVVTPRGLLRTPVTSVSTAPITARKEGPIMGLLVMHVLLLVISSIQTSAKNPAFLTSLVTRVKCGVNFSLVGFPAHDNISLTSEFVPFPLGRLLPWPFRSLDDLILLLLIHILISSFLSVSGLLSFFCKIRAPVESFPKDLLNHPSSPPPHSRS